MKRILGLLACTLPLIAFGQTRPGDIGLGAGFGGAMVSMDSEFIVGSAPVGWQTGDEPPGRVYRYARSDDGQWVEVGVLTAPDGTVGDDFGRSLLVHGPHLAVGAPGQNTVYVFEKNAEGEFHELGRVTPSSIAEGYEFGGAYARAGFRTQATAFVGLNLAVTSFNQGEATGAVHVFGLDSAEKTVLRGTDGEGFGGAIVGDNERLYIGSPAADGGKGAVDIYALRDGELYPEARLTVDDLPGRAGFGSALAIHGDRLFVGAPMPGQVVAFRRTEDGSWLEAGRLQQPAAEEGGPRPAFRFGGNVVANDDHVLVGAGGAAFVFRQEALTRGFYRIDAPDDRSRRGFGIGVALGNGALVVGSPSADYEEGLASVFESSDGIAWNPAGTLAPDIAFLESIRGDQIDCEEGAAAMFDCEQVDLISFVSSAELTSDRGVKMTDIWGWEDPETGKEYVLQARTDGTAFIDISNPSHPVYVGELLRTEGSPGAAWRDVKTYKDHAFIVADGSGEHGVQIFDLRQLRDVDPADMPVTFEMTAHYTGTASTHNIVINEETGFAYAVGNRAGGETCSGQAHMIDIRDPANPKFAGCAAEENSRGTHDAQCVIYRGADSDYVGREICLSSNGSSFVIADVTDKESPVTVSLNTYPMTHYTHQGWLTEDHNYFYMNDELDEMNGAVDQTRTLIWDVQDLEDPQLVNQFYLNSGASDHNLYTKGNFMYQSNYQAGLRILDITDPVNPVEVGHFDTAPYAEDAAGFGGSWSNYPYFKSGIIAVSSRAEGVFLLKFRRVDS